MLYFCHVAPAPKVNVTVVGSETVGSSLSLKCDITVVNGINGSVEVVWMKDDEEVSRENDTVGYLEEGLIWYTSYYNITMLNMSDDNITYQCQAIISTVATGASVKNSDNYTLNLIGKCM